MIALRRRSVDLVRRLMDRHGSEAVTLRRAWLLGLDTKEGGRAEYVITLGLSGAEEPHTVYRALLDREDAEDAE